MSVEMCFRGCLGLDNVAYTAMVCRYMWNGEFDKSKEVFVEMRSLGLELNEFNLSAVLGASFDVKEGDGVKSFLSGVYNHLNNAVMILYVRCGQKLDAIKVFDEITEPDVVSWIERIVAACDGVGAFGLFKDLRFNDFQINEYTMINLLSSVGGERILRAGKQIQASL